ncbi:alpha/beta hydrolase [Rhodospirillum rubrum]|uniref:Alpha/beta hydrolase fold n=1 Tax=Rhodospirillum rubrum (strain ATCC 11170 / ATH 1.1.1 / DSM 467 / LMG 4362 / NCIMB 8255 / S1) TaxID=269796 RepID=Q2RWY2_RHORT|nr:alpha/beta hydrolase [Rhodospirillum rubrum]ABC21363.1 Alpha/beta hydrolase fold [Rhodospirillum rubrum ATCC 11170]AEO47043.1 alpha/beta hydrolase fold protein [Rhodospirillum rubrum F11]MBK5952949.1 alpha/beta hydrolase [Rhodospirillum rubrum]QXG81041.1 alpha/beta hydrolase [Rhodospirillum rubrum]HAQ01515.1 alpha/beta hydrolase [Rhodospirillum rubrum]
MHLEVLRVPPTTADPEMADRPPLVFVHGAFAGAWCWRETFMPWFAARGWDTHALSLRGHGASDGAERLDSTRLADYADDLRRVIDELDRPPVLIGHSMGGMVVQKVLEDTQAAAAVLLASVPPTGLFSGSVLMALRHPLLCMALWRIQTFGPEEASLRMVEAGLFSTPLDAREAERYTALLQNESSRVVLDMTWFDVPRRRCPQELPLLVLGAEDDAFVPPIEVLATAAFHGTTAQLLPDIGHAMMLDRGWEKTASVMEEWLRCSAF